MKAHFKYLTEDEFFDEMASNISTYDKVTSPQRIVVMTALKIGKIKEDPEIELSIDREIFEKHNSHSQDHWYVDVQIQRGFLLPSFRREIFESEEEAQSYFERFKESRRIEESGQIDNSDDIQKIFCQRILDAGLFSKFMREEVPFDGLLPANLPIVVLLIAKIINGDLGTEQNVLEFIGAERVNFLQINFPDTWRYIVELEFCMTNFSQDSPAYVAAAARYCEHHSKEPHIAGYLNRDLETLVNGFELTHQTNIDNKELRSATSSSSNVMRKLQRWESLVSTMEQILNGEVTGIEKTQWDVEDLAASAIDHLRKEKNPVWLGNVGKRNAFDSLVQIRSGDGGFELRQKLNVIENTLKSIR